MAANPDLKRARSERPSHKLRLKERAQMVARLHEAMRISHCPKGVLPGHWGEGEIGIEPHQIAWQFLTTTLHSYRIKRQVPIGVAFNQSGLIYQGVE